jgi:hypothetical protein
MEMMLFSALKKRDEVLQVLGRLGRKKILSIVAIRDE